MNKRTIFVRVVGVMFLCMFAFAFVCGTGAATTFIHSVLTSHQIKWRTVAIDAADAKEYSAHYQNKYCDVYAYSNGSGVQIDATDIASDGAILMQRVIITRAHNMDGSRSPVMSHQFPISQSSTALPPEEQYRDIFYDHCFRELGSLPDETRKLFFGFYGIAGQRRKH